MWSLSTEKLFSTQTKQRRAQLLPRLQVMTATVCFHKNLTVLFIYPLYKCGIQHRLAAIIPRTVKVWVVGLNPRILAPRSSRGKSVMTNRLASITEWRIYCRIPAFQDPSLRRRKSSIDGSEFKIGSTGNTYKLACKITYWRVYESFRVQHH